MADATLVQRNGTGPASSQRLRWWLLAMLGVATLYAILSLRDAGSASRRLQETASDLAEITQKIDEIQRLSTRPQIAALEIEPPAAISDRVTNALRSAGLGDAALLELTPGQAVRVSQSEFRMRSTTISIAAADLATILTFCAALEDDQTGSIVRDLLLKEPRGGPGGSPGELWEAELVLTQMIFSPTSRSWGNAQDSG